MACVAAAGVALLLPVDRGFARWDDPERLRDRGGEDARVAMLVRLQDQRLDAPGHTPALVRDRQVVPQPPQMICRTDAAAEREAGCDGSGDIGLRERHRLRDVSATCKLAGQR